MKKSFQLTIILLFSLPIFFGLVSGAVAAEVTKSQVKLLYPSAPDVISLDQLEAFNKASPVKITEEQITSYNSGDPIQLTPEQQRAVGDLMQQSSPVGGSNAPKGSSPAIKFQYPWSNPENGLPGLVNQLYLVALGLGGGAAFVVLIYSAILWTVSGAIDKKAEALERIKGAIYGLALLLGAYLILYAINPNLVNLSFSLSPLKTPSRSASAPSAVSGYTTAEKQSGVRSPESIAELVPAAKLTEETARSSIKANGSGLQILGGDIPCGQGIYTGTTKGCVSFDGVRGATVNEMLYVADLVGGKNMIITSVTEGNHVPGEASHSAGNKFDAQGTDGINGALDKFITQNRSYFEQAGFRTDIDGKTLIPLFKNKETGAIWAHEPRLTYTDSNGLTQIRARHWDVQVR